MRAQLHQHRLLTEVDSSKLEIKPAHLAIVTLSVNLYEFVWMASNAIPCHSIIFFVLEDWIQQATKLDNCMLIRDCTGEFLVKFVVLVPSDQNPKRSGCCE